MHDGDIDVGDEGVLPEELAAAVDALRACDLEVSCPTLLEPADPEPEKEESPNESDAILPAQQAILRRTGRLDGADGDFVRRAAPAGVTCSHEGCSKNL